MRILLAEDEKDLSKALQVILKHNHYSVDVVENGQEALDFALTGIYDVVVLDIMMPVMDGITALKLIREKGITVPVILLTAKSEIEDRVNGLDAGADDYLTKPFAVKELLARIRAVSRRKTETITEQILTVGNLSLNMSTYELFTETGSIKLANKEFQIMEMFLSNPKVVIPLERFYEKIWGFDGKAEHNIVWVYISYLRKKLNTLEADVEIRASRNAGYTLTKKAEPKKIMMY